MTTCIRATISIFSSVISYDVITCIIPNEDSVQFIYLWPQTLILTCLVRFHLEHKCYPLPWEMPSLAQSARWFIRQHITWLHRNYSDCKLKVYFSRNWRTGIGCYLRKYLALLAIIVEQFCNRTIPVITKNKDGSWKDFYSDFHMLVPPR